MSTDHPDGANLAGLPFSFRTFSGMVTRSKGPCGADMDADIIEGTTRMSLPGLGSDTDTGTMLPEVSFKLCQTKLREVILDAKPFPNKLTLPVGSTGVFVNGVRMNLTLDPGYTTVQFDIGYVSGPMGELVKSDTGTVTIDTRGLFDLQTTGKVLGVVGYDGHIWVAWDPLDVGVDVGVDYLGGFITGRAYAHLWKGQGWQHKYSWLPDNPDELALCRQYQGGHHHQRGPAL